MIVRGFIMHKPEEKYSDCADFFNISTATKRVAVSDGVGQSILPLEWAKILVNAYLSGNWTDLNDVADLQKEWYNEARSYLTMQQAKGEVTYILENSLEERDGAGATFCGLHIIDKNHWECEVLGDSCLITCKDEKINIITSQSSLDNNRPDYYDSFLPKRGEIKRVQGELREGECLLLVSDPFSGLLYDCIQKRDGSELLLYKELTKVKNSAEFNALVNNWREKERMHADDSTLVVVEYDGKDDLTDLTKDTLDSLIVEEERIESAQITSNVENVITEKQNTYDPIQAFPQNSTTEMLSKKDFLSFVDIAYDKFIHLEEKKKSKEQNSFYRHICAFFDKKSTKETGSKEFFSDYWNSLADTLFK